MDIKAIQQGLANAAAAIPGLYTNWSLPEELSNVPFFCPVDVDLEYNQTFSSKGLTAATFTAAVFVSISDHDAAWSTLFGFLAPTGSNSIKAALEVDRTLGGACSTLIVDRVTNSGHKYTVGSSTYLGAEFEMRVWAR